MTAQQMVDVLNEALAIDRKCVSSLIDTHCCTDNPDGFEAHRTIVPYCDRGVLSLGVLGLINGFAGLDNELIETVFDGKGLITSFRLRVKERSTPDVYADAAL